MNKHAKQYAKDWSENDRPWELWECTHISSGEILPLIDHPKWEAHCNYRRKKQTININGYEVPEPERVQPEIGVEYFTLTVGSSSVHKYVWDGDHVDIECLNQGVVHLTSDAAKLHLKALLSFTDGTGPKERNYGLEALQRGDLQTVYSGGNGLNDISDIRGPLTYSNDAVDNVLAKKRQAQIIACSAVDLSEMLRSDAIEKSKYFDIAELHMKVLVDNILKGLGKNG